MNTQQTATKMLSALPTVQLVGWSLKALAMLPIVYTVCYIMARLSEIMPK